MARVLVYFRLKAGRMLSPPPASKRKPLMSLTSPSQALVLASVSWEPGMSSIDCSLVLQNSHTHPPGTVGSDPSPRGPLTHAGLSSVAPLSLIPMQAPLHVMMGHGLRTSWLLLALLGFLCLPLWGVLRSGWGAALWLLSSTHEAQN